MEKYILTVQYDENGEPINITLDAKNDKDAIDEAKKICEEKEIYFPHTVLRQGTTSIAKFY